MGAFAGELTWSAAAESALFRILSRGVLEELGADDEPSAPILSLRSNLDYLVNNYLQAASSPGGLDSQVFIQFWELLGFGAAQELHRLGEIPDSVEIAAKQICEVLTAKQRDYGHENIARFGRTGLMIRMHDKIARLENLQLKTGLRPANESVADNLLDVIGYSAIGLMWEYGTFMLEL